MIPNILFRKVDMGNIGLIITTIIMLLLSIAPGHAQDLDIEWIEVRGGTFTMGSGNSARQETLSSFYMSATEVTFDQYDTYCKATGTKKPEDNGWGRGNMPVINVSWDDAIGFCRWLSQETGSEIRLPTEAEWEYAAIGGSKSKGYTYSGSNNWKEVSWSEGNSGHRPHPVGGKKPNELGLYDMSGNVWEWCADQPGRDGNRVGNNNKHAVRGNSNGNPASDPREFAIRIGGSARHNNIGFRIVKMK
jgi:formylglycine-generating enzyme required for sulfatase activity